MKKLITVVMIVMIAALAVSCAETAAPAEEETQAQATQPPGGTELAPSIDEGLLAGGWELVDTSGYSGMENYLQMYQLDNASVLLSRVSPYGEEEDLEKELDANIEGYEKTLEGSMAECDFGEVSRFLVDGYPAARFRVEGKLTENNDAFVADTVWVVTPDWIYSLQMQDVAGQFDGNSALFDSVADSFTVVKG